MIKFSKARQAGYNPKGRRWDIRLSHNNKKVGEINKSFSDWKCRHPNYTLELMGTIIQEGIYNTIKTKRFYDTLGEAKGVARAILKDKELLISILTCQSHKIIKRDVNQAWSAT